MSNNNHHHAWTVALHAVCVYIPLEMKVLRNVISESLTIAFLYISRKMWALLQCLCSDNFVCAWRIFFKGNHTTPHCAMMVFLDTKQLYTVLAASCSKLWCSPNVPFSCVFALYIHLLWFTTVATDPMTSSPTMCSFIRCRRTSFFDAVVLTHTQRQSFLCSRGTAESVQEKWWIIQLDILEDEVFKYSRVASEKDTNVSSTSAGFS